MTCDVWFQKHTALLSKAGIGSARLDCLILLEDILHEERAYVLAHLDEPLTPNQLEQLDAQVQRRLQHEPLAYIRGSVEFYGRRFYVNHDVLVPRPESETIISLLLEIVADQEGHTQIPMPTSEGYQPVIVDVGTGSGALAITAKLEQPKATVYATDISPACLRTAQQNAETHAATVHCVNGDLLAPLKDTLGPSQNIVLLCNLPYVPDGYEINQAAAHEPKLALFAGKDGLDAYRHLFEQITDMVWRPKAILTESLSFQHDELCSLAAHHGYQEVKRDGLVQTFLVDDL
ncbi:MAG TPA: peptide chain release factor N(5)-glutamine methyltransferase [Candidatus Limnocylindrales bacterium]|nr:peptide chain release factor N(5)-glutamine methyltransferase [Candidatus Limnocylindrales bacterium]